MEKLNISRQTLREFINAPFGMPNKQKNLKYEEKYRNYRDSNKIKIESAIELDKNYFIHIKIPSESQKGLTSYDVVIQFFTPNSEIERQLNVENYYVQFFSNSPGFVYKYASLYKLQGYLIESLTEKFDPAALNTLPDKANKEYELYYDSSIYYASRYLLDHKFFILGKLNLKYFTAKKSPDKFFADIMDIDSKNLNRTFVDIEQKVNREIEKDRALSTTQEQKLTHSKNGKLFSNEINRKKKSSNSTFRDSSNNSKRITSKTSTSGIKSNNRVSKKVAKKTTRH